MQSTHKKYHKQYLLKKHPHLYEEYINTASTKPGRVGITPTYVRNKPYLTKKEAAT